jgi:hypothetical protein
VASSDSLGWCLAFVLPALVLAGPLRRDRAVVQAYLFVVTLHIAVAAIYAYLSNWLPDALIRDDAIAFHRDAISWQLLPDWPIGIGSHFYAFYLAYVYRLLGPSFFLASILSVYAFAFSVIVFIRMMDMFDVKQGKGLAVLLFGALPTTVLYGTVPLREAYQVLFFVLACYGVLRFRLTNQPLQLIVGVASALLMGLLHKGLIVYAPFLVTIMLFVRVDHAPARAFRRRVWLHRFVAAALSLGFVAMMSSVGTELRGVQGAEVLTAATTGSLVDFTLDRRDEEALTKGRTAYGVALETSSPLLFVVSSVKLFFYYMFTPFPWQVRNVLDIYAFGESILRIVMLAAIWRMWRQDGPVPRHIVNILMIVYVSMAFLWAAGTSNYGTATRHHMIHQWILVLLGVPALIRTTPAIVLDSIGWAGGHRGAASSPRGSDASIDGGRPGVFGRSALPARLQSAPCRAKGLRAGRVALRPMAKGLRQAPRRLRP